MRRGPRRVFKDASKLSPSYVPGDLAYRKEEFRQLARFFKPVVEHGASQKVLIYGPGGSGKTALALRFSRVLELAARERKICLKHVYIDCREWRSPYQIAWKLAKSCGLSPPRRGYSTQRCLEGVVEMLDEQKFYLTLILDWFDFHVRQYGSEFPYSICRQRDGQGKVNRISLISISREPHSPDLLDAATRSTFLHNRIDLGSYSTKQLKGILLSRADAAFARDAVSGEVVELISRMVSERGDAGLAIGLLRCAGKIANEKGERKVTPEHVRKARALVRPEMREEEVKKLREHERLLFAALVRKLKSSDRTFVLTGELVKGYRNLCRERSERPRCSRRILTYVKRMSCLGLIEVSSLRKDGGLSEKIGFSRPFRAFERTI